VRVGEETRYSLLVRDDEPRDGAAAPHWRSEREPVVERDGFAPAATLEVNSPDHVSVAHPERA
jgi:hypothetical protein